MAQPGAEMTSKRRIVVTLVIGMATFLSTVTASMVNVSLPTLANEFAVDLPTVQWVVLAYFATVASLHISVGRLADLMGRKRVYLTGLVLFAAASIVAAFSPGVRWLVAARVAQGFGASTIQANSPALLTYVYPAAQRGRALGYWGFIASAGLASGPVIGGLILGFAPWPVLFLVLVPWAVAACAAGFFVLPTIPRVHGERFDIPSAALLILWITPAVFALNRGFRVGWTSAPVLVALAAVGVFITLFLLRLRRADYPLIDLSIFRSSSFSTAVSVSLLGFVSLSSVMLLAPFMLQNVMAIPVAQVGAMLAIYPVVSGVTAIFAGRASDRFGPRILRTSGILGLGSGYVTLAFLSAGASMFHLVTGLAIVGVGNAFWGTPNSSAIMGGLPREKLGIAGGLVAATRTFGWASGQAIWGGVFALVVLSRTTAGSALDAGLDVQTTRFRTAFLIAAAMTLAIAAPVVPRWAAGCVFQLGATCLSTVSI